MHNFTISSEMQSWETNSWPQVQKLKNHWMFFIKFPLKSENYEQHGLQVLDGNMLLL